MLAFAFACAWFGGGLVIMLTIAAYARRRARRQAPEATDGR